MAQVWNALNSLSQTVGRRGGISDAMLRGADASIGLKKAEYYIARGQKADAMAEKNFALGLPGKELAAQKNQKSMEMVPIEASSFFPKDVGGITHTMTPRTEDGKSLFDDLNSGLPGSSWNEAGKRINKDGTEVKIPRWELEERYLPSIMSLYTARMDPIKKLNDKLYETEESLKAVDPNDQEFQTIKGKSDLIRKTLSDPNQLATMYAKKASILHDQISWGMANNVRPDFINIMKAEADKAEANYQKYGTKMTPEQRQVFDADLAYKKSQTEENLSNAIKNKALANKAGRPGTGKPMSLTDRMKIGKEETARFAMENGLEIDPTTGQISGGDLSPEEAEAVRADAKQRGLDVFFNEETVDDKATNSDWVPFNSKKVKRYTVKGAMPGRDFGLQAPEGNSEEVVTAPTGKTAVVPIDAPKLAVDINTQYSDMSLPDIATGLKKQNVGPEDAKKILREIQTLRTQKGVRGQADPKLTGKRKPTTEELDAIDDERKRKEAEFIGGIIPNLGARIKASAERDRRSLATHMGR